MIDGVLAIVGSPNVGKSTLFNRIIGDRLAIVDDTPGLTRDRLYGKAHWLLKDFRVIDTGGIQIENAGYQTEIRAQVAIAIEEADVILFVVDGQVGVTRDDQAVARLLYKSKKPVVLAVNKIDDGQFIGDVNDFYQLGFGTPIAVSSTHGIGIGDMLDAIVKLLPSEPQEDYEGSICFSVVGRPNVGKSSLVNAILKQERVIVSDREGTTRDAIDTAFKHEERAYVVIDTAGLRKRGRIFEAVDKYAALRALKAIDRSDVVLLVIDGEQGIIEQDKHVAGYAFEAHKAIIIVVNKWDLVKKDQSAMADFSKKVRDEFKFLDYAPIVFVSAKNKTRIATIFDSLIVAYEGYNTRVATSLLNDIIQDAQIMNPTPHFNGGRLKIYYANQVDVKPPTFVLFVNEPDYMHFSYKRYLENRLRETFHFEGSPINLITRIRK
jgi:GTP-binding protein